MATSRTINRLINSITQLYKGAGVTLPAQDTQALLEMIQDRLAEWSGHINIPVVTTEYFAMVSGTSSYTIGENGTPTKDTARPNTIVGAYVRQSNYDYPVQIITEYAYRNIHDKTTTGRPEQLYPDYSTPNVTVYLYPVPDTTDSLYFASIKDFTEPSSIGDDTFNTLQLTGTVYNALKWRVALDAASILTEEGRPFPSLLRVNADEAYNKMLAQHLAKNMRGATVELALKNRSNYSLSDFFAGR